MADYNRPFYRNVELTVDIVYPLVYLFFFGLLISWLFQRGYPSNSPMRKFNVMPLGAWFFDLIENISIVILLSVFPSQPIALGWLLIFIDHDQMAVCRRKHFINIDRAGHGNQRMVSRKQE